MIEASPPHAPPQTIADLGERQIIARIQARTPPPPAWVPVGIGDDAAVVEPERNTLDVITTDALVEGVHFDRRLVSLADVGFKLLAVSLSDLAAMGATPRTAVLSLALPPTLAVTDLDDLVGALVDLAVAHRVALVGGNITRSPGPLFAEVTAIGAVRRRRVLRRAGARPGDDLYVSGTVGAAAGGLAWLEQRASGEQEGPGQPGPDQPAQHGPPAPTLSAAVARFRRPAPRVRLGTLLGRNRAASACIDLSDGLGAALHQLAEASGVGVSVDAAELPVDADVCRWLEAQGADPIQAALVGGEDYELAFTVPRRRRGRLRHVRARVGDLALTRIGRVTNDGRVVLSRDGHETPVPGGFAHF